MSRQLGSKKQQYDVKNLEEVPAQVRAKIMSQTIASKVYNIPKTTLHDRVHNKYEGSHIGAKPVLTVDEEKRVADWTIYIYIPIEPTVQFTKNMMNMIALSNGLKCSRFMF